MNGRFSPAAFLLVFCAAYMISFALDFPLFRYYPLHGDLSWGKASLSGAGPGMAWYGFMANALLAATSLALCIPESRIEKLLRNFFWLPPLACMAGCLYLLRNLFA